MSVLGMEQISKTARKLFQFQNVLLMNHRGVVSKKLEREKKVLFGKLVETLPEKRKRELLENDEIVIKKTERGYKKNQEEILIKNTNKKDVLILSNSKNPVKLDLFKDEEKRSKKFTVTPLNKIKNNLNTDDSSLSTNDSTTTVESRDFSRTERSKEQENVPEIRNKTEIKDDSKKIAPSQIVIKNMLSFSIFDSVKTSRIKHKKMPISEGIISLSARTDFSSNNLPSVTRILSATMSDAARKILAAWKEEMIKKLGEDGFDTYQKNLFKDGHDLHSSIENALLKKEYKVPKTVQPAFESVQNVLKDISSVSALETHVVHPKLFYRGITDCVATYRGDLCLIDWKKSDKRKDKISSVYDAPVQVASYIGAVNADLNYPFEIKKGLVVVAYTNGEEATVHEMNPEDLFIYWKVWLRRLQKYFVDLETCGRKTT